MPAIAGPAYGGFTQRQVQPPLLMSKVPFASLAAAKGAPCGLDEVSPRGGQRHRLLTAGSCPAHLALDYGDRMHLACLLHNLGEGAGRGLAFHSNLITCLRPLAEHNAKQVVLASGQEGRAGDLIWSKHAIH